MYNKILVPLDGSDLAELALPYAEELADAFNSEVFIAHVSESADDQYQHMHQLYIEEVAGNLRKPIKTSWEQEKRMEEKFEKLSIHKKMEIIIKEIVDKELLFRDAMREFEKIYIETASKKYSGNMTKIAKALGIHRNTLNNRVRSLKISKKN